MDLQSLLIGSVPGSSFFNGCSLTITMGLLLQQLWSKNLKIFEPNPNIPYLSLTP